MVAKAVTEALFGAIRGLFPPGTATRAAYFIGGLLLMGGGFVVLFGQQQPGIKLARRIGG